MNKNIRAMYLSWASRKAHYFYLIRDDQGVFNTWTRAHDVEFDRIKGIEADQLTKLYSYLNDTVEPYSIR